MSTFDPFIRNETSRVNDLAEQDIEHTAFACENQRLDIACASGFITIIDANYGRTISDSEQCPFQQ